VQLAERMGVSRSLLLRTMSSSDWTQHRAASLIEAAQQMILYPDPETGATLPDPEPLR
jgi:hypothetical protein